MSTPSAKDLYRRQQQLRRKRSPLGIVGWVLALSLLGVAGFLVWDQGFLTTDQQPAVITATPTPEPTPRSLTYIVPSQGAWERRTLPLGDDLPETPRERCIVAFEGLLEALAARYPAAIASGAALSEVFADEEEGVVTLNLRLQPPAPQSVDIATELRILRTLSATALIYYPTASGVRWMLNGEEQAVLLHHLAGDRVYPRSFVDDVLREAATPQTTTREPTHAQE